MNPLGPLLVALVGGLTTLGIVALFAGTGDWLGTPWDGLIGITTAAVWVAIGYVIWDR